ncbi:endogenous retrovirus group K member 10 Gag polyprotein-like [Pantherophis guttatus]|uniref:Gag polyprotein n=1 Tax=Pantherophis guttatus TaxID=94885 RepID=A0A6P9B2P0_PANGU|nr:endogenous retrovirus group K member 10 Gag polyprotein-like [Pantherophis guttatus]XP_060543735.1 endogenous retrovirus group K member 10 Gag polyprotein-like [Pantherophis guttatus]
MLNKVAVDSAVDSAIRGCFPFTHLQLPGNKCNIWRLEQGLILRPARTDALSAFGLLNLISLKVSVSMGPSLSQGQWKHVDDLVYLLKKSELSVSQKALYRLVREIALTCSFYPDRGSLKLSDWEKVGKVLHSKISPEVDILHAWQLCRHAIEMFGQKEEKVSSLLTPPSLQHTTNVICPPLSEKEVLSPDSKAIIIPSVPALIPSAPSASSDIEPKSPSNIVPKSSFQKMVENCKTDVAISGEELAELLSVCPGQYQQGPQAGPEGLPFQILRELKKAISDYGVTGNFTRGLLEGIKNGYTMVPQDWKQLCRMILTPMQYVVWESEYLHHSHAAALRGGGAYTVEQLFGSGQFATIPTQLVLPPATLAVVSECAFRAFLKVPQAGEPKISFSNIHQGATEPYADFVERLSKALHRQLDNQEAAAELLRQLAIENANVDCKRALRPLKATNQYTLADMLRVCQDIGSQSYNMRLLAAAIQKGTRPVGNCFKCGKVGHFQKDCRSTPSTGGDRPTKKCPICKKGFHWANQCRFRSGKLQVGVAPTQKQKCAFPVNLLPLPPPPSLVPPQPQQVALGSI